jgi:MFS family permease
VLVERRRAGLGASYRKLFVGSAITNLGDGVGTVAYPWLASAVTRNPLLITLIAVAQRLPWLVFTLPAGVITDRVDRRRVIVLMDTGRGVITTLLAIAVAMRSHALPAPDAVERVAHTDTALYGLIVLATLLLGFAEVLRDNSAQTLMPALVASDDLEKANGRLWSVESITNTFAGPPLGSLLIAAAFALPIFFDAASFFGAAALVFLIPGTFRAAAPTDGGETAGRAGWRAEMREGLRWLWHHPLLRPMAIILGLMNMASMVSGSLLVLYVQEVLHAGAAVFAIIGMGGAIGAVIGGAFASYLSRRLGSGTCLAITLGGSAVIAPVIGLAGWWPIVFVLSAVETLLGMLWNVITVSLRQSIIPSHLLGRVNSVYRFFAWGMMPVGALLGGLVVAVVSPIAGREPALRSVWLVSGAIYLVLFVAGRRSLTTEKIEAARAAGSTAYPLETGR